MLIVSLLPFGTTMRAAALTLAVHLYAGRADADPVVVLRAAREFGDWIEGASA